MPVRRLVRRPKTSVSIGDMSCYVTLQERALNSPINDGVDYSHTFTREEVIRAAIISVRGSQLWNGVETEDEVITHRVYIRALPFPVTPQHWLLYQGERYDIKAVEKVDERSDFLELSCVKQGDATKSMSGVG